MENQPSNKNLETFEKIRNEIKDFKNKMNRSFKSLEERLNKITQQEKSKNVNSPNIRQKPKKGEVYYFLDSAGYVSHTYWTGSEDDLFRFNIGNCFTTEEEANDFKENLLTKQLLKDLALELNKGVKIDWKNDYQIKYHLGVYECMDEISGHFAIDVRDSNVHCLDPDFVKIAKQRIGKERLIKLIKSEV